MDDVLGRMAEGPRFADLWEAERRYAGVLQAWMNVRRRGLEHNAVVLEAWLQAGRRFTEQLCRANGRGRQTLGCQGRTGALDRNRQSTIAGNPALRTVLAVAGGDDSRDDGIAHGAAGTWSSISASSTASPHARNSTTCIAP